MKTHWIWLSTRRGVGPVRQHRLLDDFGSAEAVFHASAGELDRAGVEPAARRSLEDRSLQQAEAIARACARDGITVLTLRDPDYPASLRGLPGMPVVLYVRGVMPDLEQLPGIALVGSRGVDRRGLELARRFGWQIAGCGGAVITGLARGVDTAAAWGALDKGGPVIGVLGCGPDVIYPAENAALYDRVSRQGCLVSEYPPGTKPTSKRFPARNRIISALSVGVTVVRAALQSGALITAKWALEQNRDVFAVPGDPEDPMSLGCIRLLREGAVPAQCGWDVVSEYEYRYPAAVREYHGMPEAPAPSPKEGNPGDRPEPDAPAPTPAPDAAPRPAPEGLTPIQLQIFQALSGGPLQLDALLDVLELPAGPVLQQLTVLQIKGLVACRPGKYYTLT